MERDVDGFFAWAGASQNGVGSPCFGTVAVSNKATNVEREHILTDNAFSDYPAAAQYACQRLAQVTSIDMEGNLHF